MPRSRSTSIQFQSFSSVLLLDKPGLHFTASGKPDIVYDEFSSIDTACKPRFYVRRTGTDIVVLFRPRITLATFRRCLSIVQSDSILYELILSKLGEAIMAYLLGADVAEQGHHELVYVGYLSPLLQDFHYQGFRYYQTLRHSTRLYSGLYWYRSGGASVEYLGRDLPTDVEQYRQGY